MIEKAITEFENEIIEQIKEKLQYTIDFQYRVMKENTIVTILTDEELNQIEEMKELASKEELFDLINIYHQELKRLRKDIKEIIENE
jgi:L-alanine-DL-glutamate epimerase-like enolase superfamily enzyme